MGRPLSLPDLTHAVWFWHAFRAFGESNNNTRTTLTGMLAPTFHKVHSDFGTSREKSDSRGLGLPKR